MPFPGNLSTGTVTGTFIVTDGTPARGSVRFTAEAAYALDATANVILVSLSRTVRLDENGSFTVTLAATDDPDLVPADFTYRVRPMIDGLPMPAFSISVPSDSAQDLADIAPAPGSGGTLPEGPLDPAVADLVPGPSLTHDALVDLIEETAPGGGGGGAVDSVNGHTGVVVLVKSDLSLGNVDNTSDVNKPVSTATSTAISAASTADRTRSNHTGTQSAGTITGLATVATTGAYSDLSGPPTIPDDTTLVHKTGTETVAGVKTFSSSPVVPDSSFTIAKTTGLQTAIDGKSATGHVHPASDVTSGTLAVARIGSGTAAAGKYVDGGTGAWTTLPAGGDVSPYLAGDYPVEAYGFFATSVRPEATTASANLDVIWSVRLPVLAGQVITRAGTWVHTAGSSMTGLVGFALYDDAGALVTSTATDTALFATTGWRFKSFPSPVAAEGSDRYVWLRAQVEAQSGAWPILGFRTGPDLLNGGFAAHRRVFYVGSRVSTWPGTFSPLTDGSEGSGYIPIMGLG
jgi:hypothetical protein